MTFANENGCDSLTQVAFQAQERLEEIRKKEEARRVFRGENGIKNNNQQNTANSKQQTANSKQQTANNKRNTGKTSQWGSYSW